MEDKQVKPGEGTLILSPLRDQFAMAALTGYVSAGAAHGALYEDVAKWSYQAADAMLAERAKPTIKAPMEAQIAALRDSVEAAWHIIANAGGGNWKLETEQWQEAAATWRDEQWHRIKSTDRLAAAHDAAIEDRVRTEERDGLRKRVESLNETCAAYKEQTKELLARLVDESGRRIQPATTSNAPPVPERQDDRICVVWAEEPGVPVGLQKTEGSIVVAVGATVSHVAYYRAQRLSKSLQQFLGQESSEDLTRERDQLRAQLAERDGMVAALREALDGLWAGIGDALCSGKGIAKEYSQSVATKIREALANTAQAAADHDERVRAEERERLLNHLRDHRDCYPTKEIAWCTLEAAIADLSTAGKEEP